MINNDVIAQYIFTLMKQEAQMSLG